ncbi:MAG: peptide chain release factor N(5)-glutamine methyltransferase [Chitinophagaceae bacterium]
MANVIESLYFVHMITIDVAKHELREKLVKIYDAREAATITTMFLHHITKLSATEMLVYSQKVLSHVEFLQYSVGVEKLCQSMPIQQVIGFAWFDNEKYVVNKDVLIPRPETEELLQWIKEEVKNANNIIDVGTGSGILALSLKKHFKTAIVHAVDVSQYALFIAKQNAVAKARVINWHLLDFLDTSTWVNLPSCNILVSNPPYIKHTEKATMMNNVLQFEPHEALFVGDNDALIFYRALANFALQKLESSGFVFVEINESLGKETCQLFNQLGFETVLKKDLQGKDRMIKAWKN